MSLPRALLAVTLGLAAGCASASAPENQGQPDASGPGIDAPEQPGIDAPVGPPVDAPPGPCTTMTRQLLVNESFDATPEGMGWMQAPLDALYPIVTADVGQSMVNAHSPTRKAWLGGVVSPSTTTKITDTLSQDIAIPAGTSAITITGQYWTKSAEVSTATPPYDGVTMTFGAETVYAGGNHVKHTAWQPLSYTVANAAALAGQTVRLEMKSTHDFSNTTSFWFDSLAVTATYCQ